MGKDEKNQITIRFVSLFIMVALILSSIGFAGNSIADDEFEFDEDFFDEMDDTIPTDEPIIEGNLTQPFLKVTGLFCNQSIIHINEYVTLYTTVLNIGGSTGDENYTSSITEAKSDIANLIENTTGCAKKMLEKAEEQLDKALNKIEDNDRTKSIFHISQAIVYLQIAKRKGVDTSEIIVELATAVKDKLDVIMYEAETSFGSEHPDVKKAKKIYRLALNKFENEKYLVAVLAFELAFKKVLNTYTCDVNLTLFDLVPDKEIEEIIGELMTISVLEAEGEDTVEVIWQPTELGIHYVKTNMTGEYEVYSSPGTLAESPPTILSVGFPVSPLAIEKYTWDPGYELPNPIDGDSLTLPKTDGNTAEIIMKNGHLTIKEGGTLTFKDGVTFVIENPFAGKWGIKINPGVTKPAGQFIINSPAKSTYIYTPNTEPEKYYTYPFLNSGTVSFTGANVLYTYGPSDTTQPGGIQNLPGSTCIIDNCDLLWADTHSLYIEGMDTLVQVKGADSIIGNEIGHGFRIKGHGIFVKGATPIIEDITVRHHQQDGIHIEDSSSDGTILAPNLRHYGSSVFDYRMTTSPETTTPMRPVVAVGYVAHVAWVSEVFPEKGIGIPIPVYHIMHSKSTDNGVTWSEPVSLIIGGPIVDTFATSGIEIASDGEYVGIVYQGYEGFSLPDMPIGERAYYLLYSDDSGESWYDPIPVSETPIASAGEGFSCIDWQGDTAYIVYSRNPPQLPGQPVYRGIKYRTFQNGAPGAIEELFETDGCGIPRITVDGDDIHIVFCAPRSSIPRPDKVMYLYGQVGVSNLWPSIELTTYDENGVAFSRNAFDLVAKNGIVYFVWHNYDTDNYNIHYIRSDDHGSDWLSGTNLDTYLLTTDPGNSLNPSCVLDADMNLHVVWEDNRDSDVNLRYSCIDTGGSYLVNDISMTDEVGGSMNPNIAISQDDYVYFLWNDDRTGSSEIYMKKSNLCVKGVKVYNINVNAISMKSSSGLILNNEIKWNRNGLYLDTASNNIITGNSIGIQLSNALHLVNSDYNIITDNTLFSNRWGYTILLENSHGNEISANSFSNNVIPITLYQSTNNAINGNVMVNNFVYGVLFISSDNNKIGSNNIDTSGYHGIYLASSTLNIIQNNIINSNNQYGIILESSETNTIKGNTITHNTNGIFLVDCNVNILEGNTVSSNYNGILLVRSTGVTIFNNQLYENYNAIYLEKANGNTIDSNIITTNSKNGIDLYQSDGVETINNIITSNDVGLQVFSSSLNPISRNTFMHNDDGIIITAGFTEIPLFGESAYNLFGFSVSGAGDVNGDKVDDFIVGAHGYNSGTGAAYLYSGEEPYDLLCKYIGEPGLSFFGYSVSCAGNVNGDDYDDVIIGAPRWPNGPDIGSAYVFLGREDFDGGTVEANDAHLKFRGTQNGDEFGFSVSGAGNVNPDNFADIIIGARASDINGENSGCAYIFHGSPLSGDFPASSASLIIEGDAPSDLFGWSVSGIGRIDGDMSDDVIIGAPSVSLNGENCGGAYVYSGSIDQPPIDTYIGGSEGLGLGCSVSGVNIDGDAWGDYIIGVPGSDVGNLVNAGCAWVVSGQFRNVVQILNGQVMGESLGWSVSAAGDVNGDKVEDIICGAPWNCINGPEAGAAYIFSSDNWMIPHNWEILHTLTGDMPYDYFGYAVSGIGIVKEDDGYDDLIVGALGYDNIADIDAGCAYVFLPHTNPSNNNIVYHNNFIDNVHQAYDDCSNQWDNGYPSGGNYWSDYIGVDNFNGVNQDIPGFDGIGDTPYIIDEDSKDTYPWMIQNGWP